MVVRDPIAQHVVMKDLETILTRGGNFVREKHWRLGARDRDWAMRTWFDAGSGFRVVRTVTNEEAIDGR